MESDLRKKKTILVLGATGHFGGRICRRLVGEPNTRLLVSSRSLARSTGLAAELSTIDPGYDIMPLAIDQHSSTFEQELQACSPDIVVHTAGPYQGQGYRVARACIAAGSHYIDLADGRDFVCGFPELDAAARGAGVVAVTGASTLPGLSSAVVDHFGSQFQSIDTVTISIAPAHQTPRGAGTIAAVMSYCGQPFQVLEGGAWTTRYGWQDLRWQRYPTLGRRLSAACDVPDLSLLVDYLPGVQCVTFHAALEARWEQLGLWCMGWLARAGLVRDWRRLVPALDRLSETLVKFGGERGGMHIHLAGTGIGGAPRELTWYLVAEHNHGPEIPCTPALVLARKLARDEMATTGAYPCLGLVTLGEFDEEVASLEIRWHTTP